MMRHGSDGAFGGRSGCACLGGRVPAVCEVTVRIGAVAGQPDRFIARYCSPLLRATFGVEFEDNVMGGIALHGFAEMLRLKYGFRRVELVIEDQALRFRSKAVVDALLTGSVETTPPVASLAG